MSVALPAPVAAHLDATLHGTTRAVTFRELSRKLSLPFSVAQSHLARYAASHPSLRVHWAVSHRLPTGVVRLTLTPAPDDLPAVLSRAVWSLSPSHLPTPAVRAALREDVHHDCALASAPNHAVNPLRDGRFNRITSATARWTPAQPPVAPRQTSVVNNRGASTLLAQVKKKAAARKAKQPARNRSAPFKLAAESSNLFSQKRLGAQAASRIKKADGGRDGGKQREKPHTAKKARRIVEDDDDDDDEHEVEEEEEEEEESEAEKERIAMEREAADAEAAHADREEVKREVEELMRNDDEDDKADLPDSDHANVKEEQPESPQLNDLEENTKEPSAKERSPAKRKLADAFGFPSKSGPRRIRREVEETFTNEKGYIITRMVTKVFDGNGNQVLDEPPAKKEPEKTNSQSKPAPETPKKAQTLQNVKNGKKKLGSHRKDGKRPSSKIKASSATKKTPKKKIKGNIRSYFGKKV